MASETPGKNGTLWLFAPVQSGSPPSRALDFHCHHRKHSATTNFQQATSASPGVPQRWKQHTWLHWGARNIFTLHIQKIENGYLPKLTQLTSFTRSPLQPLPAPPFGGLSAPRHWQLTLQILESAQTKAWWVAFRNRLLWQNITTSSQEAFSEPFFGVKTNRIFFSKRTTKSFPTTVHLNDTLGVDPPTKMKVTIRDPPSKKMNASWPLLTERLWHPIHHRPSSIIKSSHHFIIEIYGALGHPLMPLPPRTQALTRDY